MVVLIPKYKRGWIMKEYFVKENKSVVTKVGIKGPGDKVTEKDFSSPGVLDALLKSDKNPLMESKPEIKEEKPEVEEEKTIEEKVEEKEEKKEDYSKKSDKKDSGAFKKY